MSRIGKAPITIPESATVTIEGNVVNVKGPKGELSETISDHVSVSIEDNVLIVSRKDESKDSRSRHGLYRSLINNMIVGVTEGYKKELELNGVGYRAVARGQELELTIGYSHNVVFHLPPEIKVQAETERGKPPLVHLQSHDKQLVGMVAAKIRSFRPPEPYKGKGIKYAGEYIRRKAGKSAAK
ncbi:MAG: 50S ribosomal protein L6 [Crocinitomicaceae bacterium]|nr:50S ribosomal protein L6 [Crocinitomicaceae bacterium]|tara:strand:- start:11224 stop:11775 length:552 start_codon:yes stop_codon:yes gene_type:complete